MGYASLLLVQAAAVDAERSVAAAGRKLGLQQHWIDFAGRKTSAKGRKGIIGAIEMADAALTQSSARALMAGYADSAANKQSAELRREFGARIETLETGLSTFSTQLQSVDTKIDRQHSELLQALKSKGKGGQGGKGKWRQQQQPLQPRFPPAAAAAAVVTAAAVAQQRRLLRQAGRQLCQHRRGREQLQVSLGPVGGSRSPVGAAVDHIWSATALTRVQLTLPERTLRHGANVCSLCLSGDDSGEATLEEVEEKFGSLEEVRGFVNAVRAQSEVIMTAAVQQGTHAAHPTAHPAWSLLSDSLTRPLTQTAHALPEWNRLYVANSLHLRPCHLLYEQHGTARLMFACDYRDSNSLGQLKDSNRLRAYVPDLSHCMTTDLTDAQQLQLQLQCSSTAQPDATEQTEPTAPTAQHTEQRHLYEPLMGAPL